MGGWACVGGCVHVYSLLNEVCNEHVFQISVTDVYLSCLVPSSVITLKLWPPG